MDEDTTSIEIYGRRIEHVLAEDAHNANYIYIETHAPITTEQKRQLANLQAIVYEYIGPDTYLCKYDPTDLTPIRDLSFVKKVNIYDHDCKKNHLLDDMITRDHDILRTQPIPATGRDTGPETRPPATYAVDIVLHKAAGPSSDLRPLIAEKFNIPIEEIASEHRKLRLECDIETIKKIQKLDSVSDVQPVVSNDVYNNYARADLARTAHTSNGIYLGDNQIIAVADTGFDKGSLTDIHPAFKNRIKALYPLDDKSTMSDSRGHGTHVAGSIAGSGSSETMGDNIIGTAPNAHLVLQSLINQNNAFTVPDIWKLFEVPYHRHGARVANNSWGPLWREGDRVIGQVEYNAEATAIDGFMWHHPDHVVVFAAGNFGMDSSETGGHIGGGPAAKNCITVGATQSSRPGTAPGGNFDPKYPSGDPETMWPKSSHGPTRERRIKPDVVAPGTAILSACSRHPELDPDNKRTQWGPTSDRLWMFLGGTSMAAPLVAGCAAALRQALMDNGIQNPSAALIKAFLINGAANLPDAPRYTQGFGRVDLGSSWPPALVTLISTSGFEYNENGLKEGETWERPVNILAEGLICKATLVYTDRSGKLLQNNLNLTVTAANNLEKRGDEGYEVENNVEQVTWDKIPPGEATIRVRANRIIRLDEAQPFAVVWRTFEPIRVGE